MPVIKQNRIKELRKRNKIKAKYLAQEVGMSYTNLYCIEQNKSKLTKQSLDRFCKFFNCRPEYLYKDYEGDDK